MKRKMKFIDGISESAWKSLAIKSLRIGWPDGIRAALKRLNKSTIKQCLICGLFEDVFPSMDQGQFHELNRCVNEIINGQYEKICQRETHHGLNYTEEFCALEKEACDPANTIGVDQWIIRNTDLTWVNKRVNNCIYTWRKIAPNHKLTLRPILEKEFVGMPLNVLDGHTFEGRRMKRDMCLLSGHYENHLTISNRVQREGWEQLQLEFYLDETFEPNKQTSIF